MRSIVGVLIVVLLFATHAFAQCGGCGGGFSYGGCGGFVPSYGGCGDVCTGYVVAPVYSSGCGCGGQQQSNSQVIQPQPQSQPEPAKRPMPGPTTYYPSTATITVNVAANSRVEINGRPTRSIGTQRIYQSLDLRPGDLYRYVVTVDGMSRTVYMRAGDTQELNFVGDIPSRPSIMMTAHR